MLCYQDRTYCGSKVEHHTCGREFTEQDHADAVRWWGSENYPLALSDFCSHKDHSELDQDSSNTIEEALQAIS